MGWGPRVQATWMLLWVHLHTYVSIGGLEGVIRWLSCNTTQVPEFNALV